MSSSDSEFTDMEEMKKCLKEAGLYDSNMGHKDIVEYYNVIKSSETSAVRECEEREQKQTEEEQIFESSESCSEEINVSEQNSETEISSLIGTTKKKTSYKPRTWSHAKKETAVQMNRDDEENLEETLGNIEEINVLGSVETAHAPLTLISNVCNRIFPPYCDPKLAQLSFEDRSKIIFEYHWALLNKMDSIQRKSIRYAPWGKPIPAKDKITPGLLKEEETYYSSYTSRTGRQIKRKIVMPPNAEESFNENIESQNSPKSVNNLSVAESIPTTSMTLNTSYIIEDIESPHKTSPKIRQRLHQIEETQNVSRAKPTRKPLSKCDNIEIIKRSKLFSDTPKRTSRVEKMFDELTANDDKKATESMRKFEDSLKQLSDEDASEDENRNKKDADDFAYDIQKESFLKKRVVPPLPAARRGLIRKQTLETIVTTSMPKKFKASSTADVDDDFEGIISSSTPNTRDSVKKRNFSQQEQTLCPLCNKAFAIDEIVVHASTCGLILEDEDEVVPSVDAALIASKRGEKMITCETCDKVFLLNTDFEVHVMECLRELNSK